MKQMVTFFYKDHLLFFEKNGHPKTYDYRILLR